MTPIHKSPTKDVLIFRLILSTLENNSDERSDTGQDGSCHVAEQYHGQREGGVQRGADNRPQQEGACVYQLQPSVGFYQPVRWDKLRNDGLDGRLLKGAPYPPGAQDYEH